MLTQLDMLATMHRPVGRLAFCELALDAMKIVGTLLMLFAKTKMFATKSGCALMVITATSPNIALQPSL